MASDSNLGRAVAVESVRVTWLGVTLSLGGQAKEPLRFCRRRRVVGKQEVEENGIMMMAKIIE